MWLNGETLPRAEHVGSSDGLCLVINCSPDGLEKVLVDPTRSPKLR